ncbi:MAG TPA: hypothetical protein VES58_05915 [Syntrophobacteria bacterium]|nr:hypothetical protein [Syntrophobacteria bacterium]
MPSSTVPERQHPLIEPDVRFAPIRLSDHLHRQADAGAFHGAVGDKRYLRHSTGPMVEGTIRSATGRMWKVSGSGWDSAAIRPSEPISKNTISSNGRWSFAGSF